MDDKPRAQNQDYAEDKVTKDLLEIGLFGRIALSGDVLETGIHNNEDEYWYQKCLDEKGQKIVYKLEDITEGTFVGAWNNLAYNIIV